VKKNTLDNNQIIDRLLILHELDSDTKLAAHYGVERQQIRQFRNATRVGLTQKIFTELLIPHNGREPK
jgi:hypothetical protein